MVTIVAPRVAVLRESAPGAVALQSDEQTHYFETELPPELSGVISPSEFEWSVRQLNDVGEEHRRALRQCPGLPLMTPACMALSVLVVFLVLLLSRHRESLLPIAFVPAAITAVCFIASAIWLTRRRAHIQSLCSALQARVLVLNEETSFAVRFRVTLYVYYMRKRGTVRLLFLVVEPRADAGAGSHADPATEQAPSYGSVDDRVIRQPLLE